MWTDGLLGRDRQCPTHMKGKRPESPHCHRGRQPSPWAKHAAAAPDLAPMTTMHRSRQADFEPFADALAALRQALEHQLLKIRTLRLLVDAGEGRFVAAAADELQQAVVGVAAISALRRRQHDLLAEGLGTVRDELPLRDVSHRAPTPFDLVLESQIRTLARLATETGHAVEECGASLNRRMGRLVHGPPGRGDGPRDRLDVQVDHLACQEARRMLDSVVPQPLPPATD